MPTTPRTAHRPAVAATGDPPALWYLDAIIYEARVRAFADSNADGIGDFRGMASRLDYLQDLGITALWILPFYPSPLRDDGYDISGYDDVHPDCGTLEDFKLLLREAHRRDIRIITELVINHTSDQHPWFQRARRAPPGSRWRDYYVWSDTPDRYAGTRIIFQDFEPSNWSWDPIAKAYYWHRFYSHQPDLNFDNPEVHKAVFRALDFWLGMGVDGLRLDAIPYLYERDGTNCENLPETHEFLKKLRRHVDRKYANRMLLAEANQWPEDAVAYFGAGDECHMAFHFPLMPRLFMSLQMEDRFPVVDILRQTPELPPGCQWALFLRNHDELTLEMVTDEERDYMYRMYAQDTQARINLGIRRRLAPLLGNDARKIRLMNGLLFSLPGTPVIYYGDEIGMGDNFFLGDRNGVRTPMQWSSDKNAGFSQANPQRLYLPVIYDPEYHYEAINVETQNNSPSSLLRWMKQLIALRKRYPTFGRGSMQLLHPHNRKVLAFVRSDGVRDILVVASLSRDVEYVECDLSAWKGRIPVELFGQNPFPPVGELPYLLTLGPYAFYWFSLERAGEPAAARSAPHPPTIAVSGRWETVVRSRAAEALETALEHFLPRARWFAGKSRKISQVALEDAISLPDSVGQLLLFRVEYDAGHPDRYAIPITIATGDAAARILADRPETVIAEVEQDGEEGIVRGVMQDGMQGPEFPRALLAAMRRRRPLKGLDTGRVATPPGMAIGIAESIVAPDVPVARAGGDQSNTSVVVGGSVILKLFRRLAEGVNPDLEMGRFLTRRRFPHVAPVLGALEYRQPRVPPVTLAIAHDYVESEGDAWRYTLDQLRSYFERTLVRNPHEERPSSDDLPLLQLASTPPPPLVGETVGAYMETARLLGQRTAEMHLVLASETDDPAFAPEAFTTLYQRALYQSMRNLTAQTFRLLRDRVAALPEPVRTEALELAQREDEVLEVFATIRGRRIDATRIRCHGDYHLAQLLHTGKDFVILDFEGEPTRSIQERRIKRSPLRDVAGILRSFDYAARSVLYGSAGSGVVRPEDAPTLEPWADHWVRWASAALLRAYVDRAAGASFLPAAGDDVERLLQVLLLEKAIYELGYELAHRPDWVRTPLHGTVDLLRRARAAALAGVGSGARPSGAYRPRNES